MNHVYLGDLITKNRIRIQQNITSQKKALDLLSEIFFDDLAEQSDCETLTHRHLLDAFVAREKIGSTALEHGIAVPHCRISKCTEPMIAVITLAQSIEFGSGQNDQDIDLICGLIVPTEESQQHLDILAALVKNLGVEDNREAIRQANDVDDIYQILAQDSE